MFRLPWISREHHEAVIAVCNRLIASLEAQNAVLAERLAEPVAVTVKLPDDFAVLQPALVRVPPRRMKEKPDAPPEAPVDYSTLDENDLPTIAKLAAKELGGPTTPYVLAQTVKRIQHNIQIARIRRNLNTAKGGTTGVIEAPVAATDEDDQNDAPLHIRRIVEKAERV